MNHPNKANTGIRLRRVQVWFKSHRRIGIFLIVMSLLAGIGCIKLITKRETIMVKPYTTGSVISNDGTIIGYRQFGHGPGLILVHGGMMASQNFTRLASALADDFTVYVPDRRGRGLSGPHGDNYGIQKEVEDIQALVQKTGAQNIFGLSSGAIVVLQAALTLPSIQKVALYEPPLPVNGSSPDAWTPRFNEEIARGDLAAAMVTAMKGTEDSVLVSLLPRFILIPFMKSAIEAEADEIQGDDVPLRELIPTMQFDPQLVAEMEGKVEIFSALHTKVLLLGGSKSQTYLKAALDALNTTLPNVERITLSGLGHLAADNGGQPERVAQELQRFFSTNE